MQTISHRIARFLERKGLLVQDAENAYLDLPPDDESPMDTIMGHSITYRIAAGPNAGRKVFTLQTIPAFEDEGSSRVASANGFSLHAGVATKANERGKLERVCRYITRPAVSEKRLSPTKNGNIRYGLKTPYSDGTTHVIFEPLDFLSRLAALVPKPHVNLTRFHGVFAPNSKHRAVVTPARRGKGNKEISPEQADEKTPAERRVAMTWAQRLRRVFNIDVQTCSDCGGQLKVIAAIEDPHVIKQILDHLENKAQSVKAFLAPESRAPPQTGLFD